MIKYKGHFKNQSYDTDIDVYNSGKGFDCLTFEIDGYRFKGGFFDLELDAPEKYDVSALPFDILKYGGSTIKRQDGTEYKTAYSYALQRYEFEVHIPIKVVRFSDRVNMEAYIALKYISGKRSDGGTAENITVVCDGNEVSMDICMVMEFSLHIGEEIYYGKEVADFETALLGINSQLGGKYDMQCCFTCQFSEYSPYGNSEFGSMLCFGRHKYRYIELNEQKKLYNCLCDLDDSFAAETEQGIQEVGLCEKYEPRIVYGGYRGFV